MTRDELFAYVLECYDAEPEYLWAKWPNYAVLRHASNRKWFACVCDVPAEKLGLEGDEIIDVLNVKVDPEDALVLRLADDIMPGYHMNKKNWVSVKLEGNVPRELIEELLDISHKLTGPRKCKAH